MDINGYEWILLMDYWDEYQFHHDYLICSKKTRRSVNGIIGSMVDTSNQSVPVAWPLTWHGPRGFMIGWRNSHFDPEHLGNFQWKLDLQDYLPLWRVTWCHPCVMENTIEIQKEQHAIYHAINYGALWSVI